MASSMGNCKPHQLIIKQLKLKRGLPPPPLLFPERLCNIQCTSCIIMKLISLSAERPWLTVWATICIIIPFCKIIHDSNHNSVVLCKCRPTREILKLYQLQSFNSYSTLWCIFSWSGLRSHLSWAEASLQTKVQLNHPTITSDSMWLPILMVCT